MRPIGIILLAAITATPLALAPGLLLEYYTTPKLAVIYLAAAFLLLYGECWWPGVRVLWRTSCGRALFIILPAQAAWVLISSVCSPDLTLSIAGTSSRRMGALTQIAVLLLTAALAAHVALHPGFTRRLMIGIEVSGAVAALYGILQYLGYDPLLPARLYTYSSTTDFVRPPATLGHATFFANFLLPVILIAAGGVVRDRRWLHGSILLLAIAAFVLTGTRSAVLGLIAGGALLAWVEARHAGRTRILVYLGAGALTGTILLSLFLISPAGQSLRVRLSQWTKDSRGGPRLLVWRDALVLIQDHWLTGIGPENFAGEFRKVQSLELSQAYPDHYHEDPHNFLLGAGAGQGVIGLVLVVSLLFLGLHGGYRCVRQSLPEGGILLGSLLAMTISFQFSPLTISNWLYYYATIGLLVAVASRRPVSEEVSRRFRPVTRVLLGTGSLAAILITGLYIAQDALVAITGKRLARGDLDGARESYQWMATIPFPADNLWCSQQAALLAKSLPPDRREAALVLAKEASANAERIGELKFMGLYQSAVLAIISNDSEQGAVKLQAAIAAAPGWPRPRIMLARQSALLGRVTLQAAESHR